MLNPDAFDLACKELFLTITAHKSAADVLGFDWKSLKASTRRPWETATRKVLTAYLEAEGVAKRAQPEVNSVEELDKLPDGTIVKDSEDEIYIMTPYDEFWRVFGNDMRFSSNAIALPARVIHLPEVKP